jgi:hypothetical protein
MALVTFPRLACSRNLTLNLVTGARNGVRDLYILHLGADSLIQCFF